MTLETIDDGNFEEFLASPAAFLLIGKEGCEACINWTNQLVSSDLSLPKVRLGKLVLGGGKLTNFKRANGVWLSHVRELPHNSIWVNGTMVKEWLGGGEVDRLTNRLEGLGLLG